MPRAEVYSDIYADVSFQADFVPGYGEQPDCYEIDVASLEIDSLHMFGKDWSEAELRLTFGDMGADAIRGLVFELVEGEDWEDD